MIIYCTPFGPQLTEKMKSYQRGVDELYDEMDRANALHSQLQETSKDLQNAIDIQRFENQRLLVSLAEITFQCPM